MKFGVNWPSGFREYAEKYQHVRDLGQGLNNEFDLLCRKPYVFITTAIYTNFRSKSSNLSIKSKCSSIYHI